MSGLIVLGVRVGVSIEPAEPEGGDGVADESSGKGKGVVAKPKHAIYKPEWWCPACKGVVKDLAMRGVAATLPLRVHAGGLMEIMTPVVALDDISPKIMQLNVTCLKCNNAYSGHQFIKWVAQQVPGGVAGVQRRFVGIVPEVVEIVPDPDDGDGEDEDDG